jgi:hypothetical protein
MLKFSQINGQITLLPGAFTEHVAFSGNYFLHR